jgi:hypothetical protein
MYDYVCVCVCVRVCVCVCVYMCVCIGCVCVCVEYLSHYTNTSTHTRTRAQNTHTERSLSHTLTVGIISKCMEDRNSAARTSKPYNNRGSPFDISISVFAMAGARGRAAEATGDRGKGGIAYEECNGVRGVCQVGGERQKR